MVRFPSRLSVKKTANVHTKSLKMLRVAKANLWSINDAPLQSSFMAALTRSRTESDQVHFVVIQILMMENIDLKDLYTLG